ncbi:MULTISPECIES: ABC-type transport auxiliary lipoprotein family protein [unclassified Pseudomonas]|uniref:ABC-type transport auxiliary lipoprotein family protein n=1 Tax=unclassified Pseudomonas TaxID=196821 RepID=UPI002449BA4B|nr:MULTISPECIES: ABC-type transport auxiliary lipoprotein family protein [unclassified Pseudomonas]MDG9926985.1 ABC-type transport auxiliary lipoprotein family protein [Pseudomonas sp. GD04042]MDH0484628.1 ABC-type transport auxiliary lipoprotein family protein [Pseudomonas sp. GD04015]MDH0602400.1 ABC-type transport auxiliary lipoprotein family protein [Pseudomonas sp. GD03869]
MIRTLLLPLGLTALLGGCSLLPEAEPVQTYLLPSLQPQAASQAQPLARSLGIGRPQASLVLDSTRIAVVPQGSEISSYKGARWSDPAPALLRDRLLEAFQADGRFAALSSAEQHLQSDFVLAGNLLAFQSEYRDGKPEVVIRFDARLVRADTQRVTASRSFVVRQPSRTVEVPAVVDAFGQASDQLAGQLVEWTTQRIQAEK